MTQQRIGGSFAPPLTDELFGKYRAQIAALPAKSQFRDALNVLHNCCAKWWDQPDSTGLGTPHPSGRGVVVPLDETIADALWDHIPWDSELDMFAELFEAIDPVADRALRDLAFHLLWHARELALDREPMTNDKL